MNQALICRSLTLLLGGICLLLGGCDLPERPRLRSAPSGLEGPTAKTQQEAAETSLILEGPGTPVEAEWETWEAYFVDGQQVGYSHIQSTKTGSGSSSDLRYELETRLYVNQGAARFLQSVSLISTETAQGQLLSFDGTVRVGPVPTRYSGSVSERVLRVETVRGGSRQTRNLPWETTCRGVVAIEQSLRQQPMLRKGETRNLKMLLPARFELATVRLRCTGKAAVPLLDGQLGELLEINCEIQPDKGAPTYSTIWTNEQGEILRTHSPDLQLIAYRTDQKTATQLPVRSSDVASIPVEGAIRNPEGAMRVAYKIQPTKAAAKANVAPRISPAPGQYVRQLDNGQIQVLVSRRDETVGKGFVASDFQPTEQDLAANFYVDTDQGIRKLVSLIIRNKDWAERDAAIELNRTVYQNIAARPQVQGFAKASSVAASWIGDPTEQAILLTALLREQKIPARVVVGLKYLPGDPDRLVYHAWTIAFVDGDWLHLDPSEGQLAAADRLVFTTTNLSAEDGDHEVDVILPMLDVMRSMQVEVVGQN